MAGAAASREGRTPHRLAGIAAAAALFLSLPAGTARADQASAIAIQGDAAFGEYLAGECVTCHQASGAYDGIPPIVGWPPETFISVLYEYRDGQRENPVMQIVAKKLSDEEMAALAAFFASPP